MTYALFASYTVVGAPNTQGLLNTNNGEKKNNKFELTFLLTLKTKLMNKRISIVIAGIAILFIAWFAVKAQLQKTTAPRQMWEYKTIQLNGFNYEWKKWSEDGNELALPVNGTAKRAELGNQGWELIAVATYTLGPGSTDMVQYFKRPK